ncbi:MAG: hypothetical protein ABEJ99_04175 [Candidatus Nanohaloarchaea archaeon]
MRSDYTQQKKLEIEPRLPELEKGWNLVNADNALQQLISEEISYSNRKAVWIDTGNHASTYRLASHGEEMLEKITIARAFTAYHHHTLCEKLKEEIDEKTGLVVLTSINQLYEDENIPWKEAEQLFDSALESLESSTRANNLKVLLTTADGKLAFRLQGRIDNHIRISKTSHGNRYSSDGFKTKFYRENGYLQTTLAYWESMEVMRWDGQMPRIETI